MNTALIIIALGFIYYMNRPDEARINRLEKEVKFLNKELGISK